ncbi:hypothetical protein OXX69_008198 [Metschnikowia pulcherrima]
MLGLRLVNPRVHPLTNSLLRPSPPRCSRITQTAFFRTNARHLKQVKVPPYNKKPTSDLDNKVNGSNNVAFKPKLGISTEIYTVPNMLTLSRIAATPFIGYFLATSQTVPAIAIFTYSCVTDFVDGYIARKYNMKSVLGSILDPAADKFLMTTCTVALAIPGSMPLYVASAIIGRDVILSFISFYIRYRSLPAPVTPGKFLDMSITTHTVHPNFLGKANTALQMFYIGGLVIKPAAESFLSLDLAGQFDWFGMIVAASTVCSGLSYVMGKNSFQSIINTRTK